MTGDVDPDGTPRRPTRTELLIEFVQTRFWSIVVFTVLLVGGVAYLASDFQIGKTAKLAVIVFVLTAPFGFLTAGRVVGWLHEPQWRWIIDVDARQSDGAIYRLSPSTFQELEVTDGQLDQWSPMLYAGKGFDREELTIEGCWRGTLPDRELLRAIEKIDECRTQLEDDAKRGFAIETKAWTIIRNATRNAVLSVVDTFESGTLPDDGEGIGQEIEKAVAQFDLDQQIRHVSNDEPDDLAPDPDEFDQNDHPDHAEPPTPSEAAADD